MEVYCFDFIDKENQPTTMPSGWEMVMVPGMPPILSVEEAFGVKAEDILPGQETFVVPEGIRFYLASQRNRHHDHGTKSSEACVDINVRVDIQTR